MKASDFYFQLSKNGDEHFFLITPKAFYDTEGCLSDESGIADEILPVGFGEACESTYEYDGDPDLGRQHLLNIGMKEIDFQFQAGEKSEASNDSEHGEYEEQETEDDNEDPEDNEIDNLLYRTPKEREMANPFDYKNVSTDKLLRHLNVMISTEAFEEAAKIQAELNSRKTEV